MREVIEQILRGEGLSEGQMMAAMETITDGQATPAQIGAFLAALRMKGETVDEITGAARVMRARATRVPVTPEAVPLVDTCGTGGDGRNTFNVSTTAAFIAAGAGLRVAKHGNRSVSSQTGSADVMEALGVRLDLEPDHVGRCVDEVGLGFLFAPRLHGAMKHVIGPRKEMGVRTIFNVLGPLTNPAGADVQVLGVFSPKLTDPLARVLGRLGARSALVVHGSLGEDEISLAGSTRITRLDQGDVATFDLTPEEAGLERAPLEAIRGGSAEENAGLIRAILSGEKGPRRDMALLNAAGALVAAGRARDFREGVQKAAQAVDSGAARTRLNLLVEYSRDMAGSARVAG